MLTLTPTAAVDINPGDQLEVFAVIEGKKVFLPPEANYVMQDKRGIYEFVLGGEVQTQLLEVRLFEPSIKKQVYEVQTAAARKAGRSNCPLCAVGNSANAEKIWALKEMEADHVAAWSRGGKTDAANCEMLCVTHNRAKGNR